jgi:uncharacterized membrane protein YecN with MAPEG domain
MLPITSLFAGILGLMLVFLSGRISMVRNKKQIALGTHKDTELEHAVRAQANFVEYTPFFLILFMLLELTQLNESALIIAGSIYVLARTSHAYGLGFLEVKNFKKGLKFRVFGTALTYSLLVIMALTLIFKAV